MEYPQNLLIGEDSELVVRQLFNRWGWVVGKDFIDVGYDFVVTPAVPELRGARFNVQVKGTVQKGKKAFVAPVSKDRLRKYAVCSIPVIIVRVLPGARVLWLDARKWCAENAKRLAGSGNSNLKLVSTNDLADQKAFLDYLMPQMIPLGARRDGVAHAASERELYLAKLDDRLRVKVEYADGRQTYSISAAAPDENVEAGLQLTLADTGRAEEIREAINFGLPIEFNAAEFRMSGSPLFAEIGAGSSAGLVSLTPVRADPVTVTVVPEDRFRLTSQAIRIDARVTCGERGIAVASVRPQPLALRALFEPQSDKVEGRVKLAINLQGYVATRPIAELVELQPYSDWFAQYLEHQAVCMSFGLPGIPLKHSFDKEAVAMMGPTMRHLAYLSRLHAIARFCGSCFALRDDFEFTKIERSEIDFVYALLRGERVEVGIRSINIEAESDFTINSKKVVATSEHALLVRGEVIGTFSVAIDINDFELLPGRQESYWVLQRKAESSSYMYLLEEDAN